MRIAMLGAGSWGTALAIILAKSGHDVALWARRPEAARHMDRHRRNPTYLPGALLPAGVHVTSAIEDAVDGRDMWVFATPSQAVRDCARAVRRHAGDHLMRVGAALLILAAVGWAAVPPSAAGQDAGAVAGRLAIFLDCGPCDETFIRQEMTYVDYVRDREAAHVHVLVTTEDTGSGGEVFTMDLIGQGPFEGIDFEAEYTADASETEDEERRGFLQRLQVALAPYLMRSTVAERMSLLVEEGDGVEAQPTDDPWKGWTIELYGDGWGDFESSQYSLNARYGVFVDRVTDAWKIRFRPYFNYTFDRFEQDEETITSESRRDGFDTFVIKSIDEHWSVGIFGDLFSSTFDNVKIRYRTRPGVEYSVFPYAEATRRQLTFSYLVGGSRVAYNDTTIFGEISEMLPEHALQTRYEVTQTWGEIDLGIEASQYLHDATKYSVEFGGEVEIRLTRGLSIDVGGDIELIHDQLYLAKGDASLEEVLLRRRQLATNFEMNFSVGFSYRFGSVYNNVVNTRF